MFYDIDRIKCCYGAYDSIILLYCKISAKPKLIDLILFSQDIPERQLPKECGKFKKSTLSKFLHKTNLGVKVFKSSIAVFFWEKDIM